MDTAAYRVRHSNRARHLQIRVSPWRGVEVIVPPRCPPARVEAFVAANRVWIDKTQARLGMAAPARQQDLLPELIRLPAIDFELPVDYLHARARAGVHTAVGSLQVRHLDRDRADAGECLRRWLSDRARETLVPQLAALGERLDLHYQRVHIRGQRTRWGSCSARGTISLNYKLLFLEPEIVRYLLVHELCHTRHLNHSTRYWNLVARCEPEYRTLDRALSAAWRAVPAWVEFA